MGAMPVDGTALWRKRRREKPEGGKRAVEPPDDWWTAERDLLASVIDEIRNLRWTTVGKKSIPHPEPIPRPGVDRPSRMGTPMPAGLLLHLLGRVENN